MVPSYRVHPIYSAFHFGSRFFTSSIKAGPALREVNSLQNCKRCFFFKYVLFFNLWIKVLVFAMWWLTSITRLYDCEFYAGPWIHHVLLRKRQSCILKCATMIFDLSFWFGSASKTGGMFMIKGTYKSERKETNSLVIGYGNSELLFFGFLFFK